jgi:hypothetical protein
MRGYIRRGKLGKETPAGKLGLGPRRRFQASQADPEREAVGRNCAHVRPPAGLDHAQEADTLTAPINDVDRWSADLRSRRVTLDKQTFGPCGNRHLFATDFCIG